MRTSVLALPVIGRTSVLALLLILLQVMSPSGAAAGCVDYEDYLHWEGDLPTAGTLALSGTLMYVGRYSGSATGIDVVDIDPSHPGSPTILGSVGGMPYGTPLVAAKGAY